MGSTGLFGGKKYLHNFSTKATTISPPPPNPFPHYFLNLNSQGLRRLRSWSQDAKNRSTVDNPATGSSVDSTQQATLNDSEQGGGGGLGGEGAEGPPSQQRQSVKSSNKKTPTLIDSTTKGRQSIVSEPNLDVGEARPLVYGYLHKLGRNGHW